MALPENFIFDLKLNNPIDEVMGSYVTLKRSGRGYVCLCPFHSEKSPSCSVNTTGGYFHCFGCGAGGDVITFVMKAENLSYIEAVKFLADRAGLHMPDDNVSDDFSRLKAKIFEMNRVAARYFNEILTRSPLGEKGRRYFAERQLSKDTIIKYGLGYAPDSWYGLKNRLNEMGYTDDELVAANLCYRSQKGKVFDAFRDRVIFPIIDLRGNVVAFGGRIIDGEGPKYLNSSDTPVFKKSRNLFSLNFAKRSDEKKLILAEGYMDVIAINQAGFENVVATLGTALTSEQARLMKQYADEVIIAYDSDGAGQTATHRAINLLSEAGIDVRIIKMEGAKDPDEYIKKFGTVRFKQLLERSDGAIDFEMRKCAAGLDLESENDRVTYLKRCVSLFADISSPIEREVYISKLSKECDVNRDIIFQQVNSLIKKRLKNEKNDELRDIRTFSKQRRENPESVSHAREYKAECGIIAYLSTNPDELDYILGRITADNFVTSFNRRVFEKLTEKIKNTVEFDISLLQSEFSADDMGKIYSVIVANERVDIGREALDDYINTLCSYAERNIDASSMSDDDFLRLFEDMKRNK